MRPNESNEAADEDPTINIESSRKRPNEPNEVADEDPNKSNRMQPNESNEAADEDPNKSDPNKCDLTNPTKLRQR